LAGGADVLGECKHSCAKGQRNQRELLWGNYIYFHETYYSKPRTKGPKHIMDNVTSSMNEVNKLILFRKLWISDPGIVRHSDKCNAFRRFGGQPLSNVRSGGFTNALKVANPSLR
jgi:hypothetical protein